MKNGLKIAMAVVLPALGLAEPSSATTLRVVYADVESFPYQIGDGTNIPNPPGAAVELLTKVGEKLGIEIKYQRVPNKRLFNELKNGEYDATFLFSFRPERQEFGVFPMKDGKPDSSRRIATMTYSLYHATDKPVLWDGKAFADPKPVIGANTGWSIVGDLANMGVKVDEAKTIDQNIRKVLAGYIAAYAGIESMVDTWLQKTGTTGIVKASPNFSSKDYFIMFSHQFAEGHPEVADAVWNEVAAQRDTVLRDLMAKYLE